MIDNSLIKKNAWGLRFFRLSRGLTQAEVADQSQISLRNYQRVEVYEVVPKISTLFRIIRCLGIDLNVFFCTVGNSEPLALYPKKSESPCNYEFTELLSLYNLIKKENFLVSKKKIKEFENYIRRPTLKNENQLALSISTAEGVKYNDLCRKKFQIKKSQYRYEEYTNENLVHAAWNKVLSSPAKNQCHCLDLEVNYEGVTQYGRNFGRLINPSWDNPVYISVSSKIDDEVEISSIINNLHNFSQKKPQIPLSIL